MAFAKKEEMDILRDLDLELRSQLGIQNNKFPVRGETTEFHEEPLRVDSSATSLIFLRHILLNHRPARNLGILEPKILPFKKKG